MIWQFRYHRGPASLEGQVETATNDPTLGLKVASAWCLKNGCRPPASVRPFMLADESILIGFKFPGETEEPLPDAVAATTGTAEPVGVIQSLKNAFK